MGLGLGLWQKGEEEYHMYQPRLDILINCGGIIFAFAGSCRWRSRQQFPELPNHQTGTTNDHDYLMDANTRFLGTSETRVGHRYHA